MYPLSTFVRRNSNRALLEAYRAAYGIIPETRRKWLFEKSVDVQPVKSSVKLIRRDGDTAWIAKVDSSGKILNEPFRILTTTDLHLGDDPLLRNKAFQLLADQIAREKPDLVVFTGDIVLSKFQQLDAVQFARFMEKTGVYWAITFGNHEAREEKGFFKWLMLNTYTRYPHCLSVHGSEELYGYGNCQINIMNGENSLLQSLFLFDSGRDIRDEYRGEYKISEEISGYDFLKSEQIEWYKSRVKELQNKFGDVKSMQFFHIPLPEFARVMELDESEKYVPTGEAEIQYGGMYESVGCSPFNSGMFDAILEMESTQAVYCGHDHINDFCAKYKGVWFIYSQYCGYETYTMGSNFGNWDESEWMQGVTITDIAPNGSLSFSQRFNRDLLK